MQAIKNHVTGKVYRIKAAWHDARQDDARILTCCFC